LTTKLYSNIIVSMSEGLTKKQLKELRKLERMQTKNIEKSNDKVKWIAISAVSALFLILFVGTIIVAKTNNNVETSTVANFEKGGHERMVTRNGDDATNSADASQAVVTLVEYADLQCPACKVNHPIVNEVLAAYPEQVKLVFKHFPLISIHKNAMSAAIAAEAAGVQGKFCEYLDTLYEKPGEWELLPNPSDRYAQYAKDLGLDTEKFASDLKDPALQKKVDDERNEGIANGVAGTPSFFVNGVRVEIPGSLDSFKKVIDEELKKVGGAQVDITAAPSAEPEVTSVPDRLPLQQ